MPQVEVSQVQVEVGFTTTPSVEVSQVQTEVGYLTPDAGNVEVHAVQISDADLDAVVLKDEDARLTVFQVAGTLVTSTGLLRIYNEFGIDVRIEKVKLSVDTAPTDASILVDIHKDGTTIFTTQPNRPAILTTEFEGESTTIEVPVWADGEYLTMDVDQIGSTIAGADLTVQVIVR